MHDIAVVIPTHNRITFVERAIDSVLNQSFTVNEIIIVDDVSTDGTRDSLAFVIKLMMPLFAHLLRLAF